jgi:PAS domain S-box-containing protein
VELNIPKSRGRWKLIVEALPQIVLTAKPDGSFDYVSPQGTSYTGLPSSALVGKGWFDIVHPEDRPSSVRDWAESIRTGNDYCAEFRLRRSDGEYRSFSFRALPARDAEGTIEMWTGTCTDVTV